ncbi:MAG: haloacid dehalogenase-like hydrolase [Cyclobacteriaceae bacterium]|nr:haloacid dehalogenase-like hydrolase [Cyclobacteriaceae bacterium]
MKLVLFDFDGTITNRDTLFVFTRFAVGNFKFLTGMLVLFPLLAIHKVGAFNSHVTKEIFLTYFFKGIDQAVFQNKCNEFCRSILPNLIRKDAYQAIQVHQQAGDKLVIVSASPQNWITPWANPEGIQVISTRLAFNEGSFTGKLNGANCNGAEKVNRIKKELDLQVFDKIIAYGDSSGDAEMFQLAHESYFKTFK